jgi:arginine/serine-rich splicing factor 2
MLISVILSVNFGFFYCIWNLKFFISGRMVDGREITVQFAKYGPNAERM